MPDEVNAEEVRRRWMDAATFPPIFIDQAALQPHPAGVYHLLFGSSIIPLSDSEEDRALILDTMRKDGVTVRLQGRFVLTDETLKGLYRMLDSIYRQASE